MDMTKNTSTYLHTYITALHMACRYNLPAQAIQLLLDHDDETKQTLYRRGINEQTPLHIAARCNAPVSVMSVLIQYDVTHALVLQKDSADRIPLHVAFVRNQSTAVIEVLLRHMFVGSMERLGVEQWKHYMHQCRTNMSTPYERDFMTREKLDVIIAAIQQLKEYVFLLELAVWKEWCFTITESKRVTSMTEVEQYLQDCTNGDDSSLSLSDYKHERRIMSGAEIIVRSVVPFLEGEPLVKYQREFPEQQRTGTAAATTTATTTNHAHG
jgi:hypothetical protein